MKFSCDQSTLSKALNTVAKAVSTRTTIPALKSILMEVEESGVMTLSASDLDFSIERTMDVQVEEAGSLAVPAKLFMDIVRKLPGGTISFEGDEAGRILVKTLNSEFNIIGTPASDFPNIPELEGPSDSLSFDRDIFMEMIRKTAFCASIDETKGVIVGILLELNSDSFNMVALDGFRMAIVREEMKNAQEKKIIVSAKMMNEVFKILSETEMDEDIKVTLGNKGAVMLLDRTKIFLRLMEGEFIKYRDILPKENKTFVRIARKNLLESVERASLLSKAGRNNLITCKIENNLMEITSQSEEGNVKEEIIVETSGDNIEIGFNSKYILDALKAIDDEMVQMEFNTGITPCLIKPTEGNRYEYLILPVRIPSR